MDDEPAIREILKLLLQLDGHTVVEAQDGGRACLLYTPGEFDLVITDYSMPGMSGAELARTIKTLVPSQPMLMLTAHAAELSKEENPVDAILEKPFSVSNLRMMLSALLHRRQPAEFSAALHAVAT